MKNCFKFYKGFFNQLFSFKVRKSFMKVGAHGELIVAPSPSNKTLLKQNQILL